LFSSLSGSIWTAFTDLGLGTDVLRGKADHTQLLYFGSRSSLPQYRIVSRWADQTPHNDTVYQSSGALCCVNVYVCMKRPVKLLATSGRSPALNLVLYFETLMLKTMLPSCAACWTETLQNCIKTWRHVTKTPIPASAAALCQHEALASSRPTSEYREHDTLRS